MFQKTQSNTSLSLGSSYCTIMSFLKPRSSVYLLCRWRSYKRLKKETEPTIIPKTVPITRVETFENVVFPPNGVMKLPTMPPEPTYDPELGEKKHKQTQRLIEARGVEFVHTELTHRQYGLAAVTGGFIKASDFAFLQERINNCLLPDQFAIWRVGPPWLPKTKKPQGTKLGGGKGSISHYVTPVRAKRIILEVGGYITEAEARSYLEYLYIRFPFVVEFVSEEILQKRRELEREIKEHNQNPFDWEKVIKYNMQNCYGFLSPYDIIWKCKYR